MKGFGRSPLTPALSRLRERGTLSAFGALE